MALTGVTNAHGPSPQPIACRSPSCSLMTATGSNQAYSNVTYLAQESGVDGGSNQLPAYLGQLLRLDPRDDLVWPLSPPIIALVGSALWYNILSKHTLALAPVRQG